jgi:hypothetical protein
LHPNGKAQVQQRLAAIPVGMTAIKKLAYREAQQKYAQGQLPLADVHAQAFNQLRYGRQVKIRGNGHRGHQACKGNSLQQEALL